jgi:hypothetical protein
MTDALINYEKNLTSVENLLVIHDALLVDEDFEKEKLTDLLRSAIVLIVSSYDNFVHDFYREKIVLNYFDDTSDEIKLNKMHLSLDSMRKIGAVINIEEKKAILSRELRLIQKTDSFQSPKIL